MDITSYVFQNYWSETNTLVLIIIGIVFFALGAYIDRSYASGKFGTAIFSGILAAYLYFVLVITVLGRPSEGIHRTELMPLISWLHVILGLDPWYYVKENVLNILLFMPLGFFAGAIWRIKVWQAFLYGLGLSLIIELIQLAACRGYFAWDDMLHNAIGCLLGALIVNAIRKKMDTE